MYFDWKPGVRLLCVDATPPPLAALWFFRSWICSGQVYTLRRLVIPAPGGPNPGHGVYLAELRNPIEPESGMEYGYLAYRFEKLEEATLLLPAGLPRGEQYTVPSNALEGPLLPARMGGTLKNGPRTSQVSGGYPKHHPGPARAPWALYARLEGKKIVVDNTDSML